MKKFLFITLFFLLIGFLLAMTQADPDNGTGSGATGGGGSQIRRPTSDYLSTYSASEGSDLYAMVDEETADGDTTYVYRADSAGSQYHGFSAFSIPGGATNIALKIYVTYRVDTGDDASYYWRIRVNGTAYTSTVVGADPDTYTEATYTWTTNPDTASAWTVDDINGVGSNPLEYMGYSCTGMASGETHYVTQVYLEATYE